MTYPITKVLGDQEFNIHTDKEMAQYEARCAERTRLNNQPMPRGLRERIINRKK